MKAIKELRRLGITLKKRYSLFMYNVKLKKQLGMYDVSSEKIIAQEQKRVMNLFDFS